VDPLGWHRWLTEGMGPDQVCLMYWGLLVVGIYTAFWILPTEVAPPLRFAYIGFGVTFSVVAAFRVRRSIPLAAPLWGALALQLWSIVTAFHASIYLGRPLGAGRADTFILEGLIGFAVGWGVAATSPRARYAVFYTILIAFGLSVAASWLQFFRIGPAMALAQIYTYKSIDNWDGNAGIRTVGLTAQPNHAAFQALVGLVLAASPLIFNKLDWRRLMLAFYFSAGVIFTQARISWIVLAVVWVYLMVLMYKEDRKMFRLALTVATVCIVAAAIVGQRRFGYVFNLTFGGKDYSQQVRAQETWAQLDHIYPIVPWTGIGPSSGLLLGTGFEDKWVPVGRVMESGYKVVLAMYGIPGLIIFSVALLCSFIGAWCIHRRRDLEPMHRIWGFVALFCATFVAINASAFNTIDNYVQLPFAFLAAGLACAGKPGRVRSFEPDPEPVPEDVIEAEYRDLETEPDRSPVPA
jgi:hypothetical protein